MRSFRDWLSYTHARLLLIAALVGILSNVLARRADAQTTVSPTPAPECSVENGFPVDPVTRAPVCPPYKNPAVFFTPHADDETIGMAGAIIRAAKQGRTVIIELMTVGADNSWYCNNDTRHANEKDSSFHPGPYRTCPTDQALAESRVSELMASAKALGATAVHVNRFHDRGLRAKDVQTRAEFWISRADPGLTLMGPAGVQDPDPHPDHVATYQGLKDAGYAQTSWQKIYQYQELKTPDGVINLTDTECEQKHQALLEYRKWDPENGRYAFGWLHSAGYLFERASRSCQEYRVTSDSAFVAYPPYRAPKKPTQSPFSIDPGTLQIKLKPLGTKPPPAQPAR